MDKKESAKERILHVASELFYQEGIRAVGIDRIIAESGVAKASFYRHFATKDDLIVAFLEQRLPRSLVRIEEARLRFPHHPLEQLRFLLHSVAERMKEPDFRGCPYMNTAVEFPDNEHPAHAAAIECRGHIWSEIKQMAAEAGAKDPDALTSQLEMLHSGAIMMAYMKKSAFNADHFYHAAMLLIQEHIPSQS